MKYLLFLTALFCGLASAQASRIVEIEDYFSERTSEFIKRRYPNRPYTVFVKAESSEESRSRGKKAQVTPLPYMDAMEGDTDIWSRKDVPLTTLITYLDSVVVRVEIDATMSNEEISELNSQLFEYLKLSTASDKIEIKKMDWISNSEALERRMWIVGGIAVPVALLIMFFLLSSLSVRSLVKGLSGPIAEIGKSTQNFAANALTLASGRADASGSRPSSVDTVATGAIMDSQYEMRKAFKELLAEQGSLFSSPTPELIEFLETEGQKSPSAVGALLCELERDTLKALFQFGYGDWWFKALSSQAGITPEAMQVLNRLGSLKIRQQFTQALRKPVDSQIKDLGLILNRLDMKELELISKEFPLKTALPIFALMPKEKCMRACKQAYPGEWGSLIHNSNWGTPDIAAGKKMLSKALDLKPLRNEQSVENFFVTLDYQRYLDGAHTKDEKEFYKALPDASPIKAGRLPFYEIFESTPELLKEIVSEVALNDWALAMKDCERVDSIKVFDLLSERQRYFLRNMITGIKTSDLIMEEKIQAKKRIMTVYQEKKTLVEMNSKTNKETYSEAA